MLAQCESHTTHKHTNTPKRSPFSPYCCVMAVSAHSAVHTEPCSTGHTASGSRAPAGSSGAHLIYSRPRLANAAEEPSRERSVFVDVLHSI